MNKIMLFTHTDLDGVGCAILAYLAFGKENVDVEYCDYGNVNEKIEEFFEQEELYRSYNWVFITDISVSKSVANMIDILDGGAKVRLFDHHETALSLNSYTTWACVRIFDRDTDKKTSGTELFYKYLNTNKYFDKYIDRHGSRTASNIREFVDIVRNWDTWRWKEELGDEGIVSKWTNDLLYIYGRNRFIQWALIHIKSNLSFDVTDKVLLEQKHNALDIYVKEKDKQLITSEDFAGNQFGIVFAEHDFSELGNSLSELHPELAYIAMIDISKGTVSYRTTRDDVDLGDEIAHSYGGGGHKKSAGSRFDLTSIYVKVFNDVFSR